MAHWERVRLRPDFAGATRAERQGGSYLRYHPDRLLEVDAVLEPSVLEYAADVSTALAKLGARLAANPQPLLYSTALRSESIASSWIEGIQATPRDIAVAQLGKQLQAGERGAPHAAALVVRNVSAMRDAIDVLGAGPWEHSQLWAIQKELLPWQPGGYRDRQVWIGGTNKLNADYAGPPHELVQPLMEDLLEYANSSGDLPVVLAALLHVQFETIHPFEDGNGRVGRALVHGVLARAGLVNGGVIPLSSILRNDRDGYISALTSYRYAGHPGPERAAALNTYLGTFLTFFEAASAAAAQFEAAATSVQERWRAAVEGVRIDSALHRALEVIVDNPVVSVSFLSQRLSISKRRAYVLVEQLQDVNILGPATGKYRQATLFQSNDILSLLAFGAELGPRSAPLSTGPSEPASSTPTLIHRCGRPTSNGPCRNRVLEPGLACWRHRR